MLSIEEISKKEVVYKIKNMESVNILKDKVYKIVGSKKLLMDMYTTYSEKQQKKLPVAILVHGEANIHNYKELGEYTSLGRLVAASGLKAIAFNHRLLSDGCTIKEVISDINSLLKYLIDNAEELNIDKDRIGIWCFSTGVPFGLYTGMYSYSDYVKCIVAYYGFGDFKHAVQLLRINATDEEIKKYSPVNLINNNSSKIPPIFIARAGLDDSVLNESIDKFIAKALINNLTIDIYNHSTGGHAFDLFNENDRTCEIISKSLDFLKKHLL